ncbi:GatB/YqeY domain-containing protein [Pararhodobacter marinus]|uniref:Glutamyl-tRNA amidotransferase n=1 Tax=Pararhodobacter marinus TaxID=2184063 RepID=A0A2U2C7F7_9RHOB|nr:GatB/YqeY domain-containing protein [Pararhodobacter marinus]PWE27828.1 glutamyl-tRNA amidotransferase [Pararhodobacter marinus]
MTLRARITDDLKQAMKNKDQLRLSTLRLINAAIKDRDIALRGDGEDREMSEDEITAVLSRMVKQRQESARAYEEAGRLELVEREEAEIKVIETYLPRQLSEDEVAAAIEEVIAELEAGSIRDMGPVMNALKSRYTGQMDFGAVGPQVKARLSGAAS